MTLKSILLTIRIFR